MGVIRGTDRLGRVEIRRSLIVLAAMAAAGACGGDSLDLGEIDPSTAGDDATAVGTDSETGVGRADYSIGVAGGSGAADLAVGERVQTDAVGHAELAFFDGSVVRLDADTTVTVAELVDDPSGPVVRIAVDNGRTWHRVPTLPEGASYEVDTPVGTAAVRGTTFFISCPSSSTCTFSAVEGAIDVLLPDGGEVAVDAPASLTIADEATLEPLPMPFDTAFGDDWLLDNGARDQALGADDPGQLYAQFGAAHASLAGTHDATGTTTRFDCDGPGCDRLSDLVHQTLERTFVFVVECEAGGCGGRATTEYQYNEQFIQENVPLRFDGSTYEWDLDALGDLCFTSEGTNLGELSARFEWTLTPTEAEVIDGRYLVTSADLDILVEGAPVEPTPPECAPFLATYSMDQAHAVTRQP